MTAPRCSAVTQTGAPCKAKPARGRDVCPWHDETPEGRERHKAISQRGGLAKAYGALAEGDPLSKDTRVASLDLGTAAGIRDYIAVALGGLALLPFDVRVANAISVLATAQRAMLETADLEARLAALEQRAA